MRSIRFPFSSKTLGAVLFIFAVQLVCYAQSKPEKKFAWQVLTVVHIKGHKVEEDNKPPYSVATFNKTVDWNLDLPIKTGLGIASHSYSIVEGDELGQKIVISKSDAKFVDVHNKPITHPGRFKLTSLTVSVDVAPLTAFKAYFKGWVEDVQDMDNLCQGKWGTTITLPVKPGAATIEIHFYGMDYNPPAGGEGVPVPPKNIVIPATVEIKLKCVL